MDLNTGIASVLEKKRESQDELEKKKTEEVKFTGEKIVAVMDRMKTTTPVFEVAKAFARDEDVVEIYHFSEGYNNRLSQSIRELSFFGQF